VIIITEIRIARKDGIAGLEIVLFELMNKFIECDTKLKPTMAERTIVSE